MSADNWATCPRCKAAGTIGMRGQEFREDWELGLNDPELWGSNEEDEAPCVIFSYTGECQTCKLTVKLQERFPIPGLAPEPNRPATGLEVQNRPWSQIPAGWFVGTPGGAWWEVKATSERGQMQDVTLRAPNGDLGTWERIGAEKVACLPGTRPGPVGRGLAALEDRFSTRVQVISDQVD